MHPPYIFEFPQTLLLITLTLYRVKLQQKFENFC